MKLLWHMPLTLQLYGIFLIFSLQMYGAIFMMAGAYTLSTEAHVRGDVLYRLFKPRTQGYRFSFVLFFSFQVYLPCHFMDMNMPLWHGK